MKQFIRFVILFSLVIACTSNTIYEKPDDLISKKIMVDLILDIQLANGARHTKNKEGKRRLEYMPLVYEKYGIDSARFARSNFYYSTKIDDYSKLLKIVQGRLEKLEHEYDTIAKFIDSIQRVEKRDKKKKIDLKKDRDGIVGPAKTDNITVK